MTRRRLLDHLLPLVAGGFALLSAGVLALIVLAIGARGLPALSWGFLTEQIRLVGAAGGIFYNLVGTLILLGTALATVAPLALGIGLTHSVYLADRPRARRGLGLFLNVLNGVPSILFGLFGLLVFVGYFGFGKSWLNGGVLLGTLILPTVTVALIERMEALPRHYLEAAAGLGLTRTQIIRAVILPQSLGGLVTGGLLGLARAAGETVPIMFTATIFAGVTVPQGVRDSPVLSLPYHIFILCQDSADPAAREKVWGAAIVLLGAVFTLSLLALPLRLRAHDEARHG